MSDSLDKRLDKILPKITSQQFLGRTGLGNEIPFYIFDYLPEFELEVRRHVYWLLDQIPKTRPGTVVSHVSLFDFLISHLRDRGLLDRAFQMQKEKGDAALLKALQGPLHEEKLVKEFARVARPGESDLVLVTGIGSAYPLLRAHTLLNNLHSLMGTTPLVMFYPGRYDGLTLCPFGKSTLVAPSTTSGSAGKANYYRALRLI